MARILALEQKQLEQQQEMNGMRAERAATAGALLAFADGRTECPDGYYEPVGLKGRMLTSTPQNATSGTVFNRAFDANEEGRTPMHNHTVTITDVGHTHSNAVYDPGHSHAVNDPGHTHAVNDPGHNHRTHQNGQTPGPHGTVFEQTTGGNVDGHYDIDSTEATTTGIKLGTAATTVSVLSAKTGIVVSSLPSESSISASVDSNQAGENYPLVYVLLCQKAP